MKDERLSETQLDYLEAAYGPVAPATTTANLILRLIAEARASRTEPAAREKWLCQCSCGGSIVPLARWRDGYAIGQCLECEGVWYLREEGDRWVRA